MTQWTAADDSGRARGPRGLLRAWGAVLTRPRQFFETAVAPGDQAPGLSFAVAVALVAAVTRFAVVPPSFSVGPRAATYVLAVVAVAGFLAPVALHLAAALQTVLLVAALDPERRAGVSETVQVVAYATAPCVFAGVPVPGVRLVCGLYGAALLTTGLSVRHDLSLGAAVALSAPVAVLVFGYGYGAVPAAAALL
jgi:hypothetical protein